VDEKAWSAIDRVDLCREVCGATPPRRVGLVCDAGLGKTTNMEWLQAQQCRAGRQVPLLLRLDEPLDLEAILQERTPGQASEALLR
jgi:hypothetical protein